MASMTVDNDDKPEKEDFSKGPLSILMNSVTKNTQVLISLRNNHKLLARVKAFDRHCNMVLENVKELWSETNRKGGSATHKDRYIGKMFLRGDNVVIVVANPAAAVS
jgi:small nuclear ribonucleoprotein D2